MVGDRYQILGLLGEGGMGRVYEAQHVVLRRRVALKLLRRDAASEAEALARFRQEALAASRIGAPEIVEVVDFASHAIAGGSQTYMVMELLAGESLEDWMDRPGRLDEGLTLLASLCDGLAAAHRADVVHRDIKPANVFLPVPDPTLASPVRVKILDFGIAKITAGGEGFQTRQGSLLGTPYYLAPERVMGAELTGAADVYSVGVILYELLTGNVPFVADSFMGILANHVHTAPLDPRQAAPDRGIPAGVAQLCLRLLSKSASERPPADAVAVELRRLLAVDGPAIAAVATGPREAGTVGADTQILSDATQALASEGTPTAILAVDSPPEAAGGRSATQIGHAAAGSVPVAGPASLASVPAPVVTAAPRSRAGLFVAAGLGGVAVVAAIVGVAVLGSASDTSPAATEQPVVVTPSAEPTVEPSPGPAVAAPSPKPIAVAEPEPEAEPEAQPEAEPAPEPAPSPRKRRESERPASSPQPEPKPESEAAPKREPKPEPEPDPAPPPSKPDPGPELPTITDDVYD